MLANPRFHIDGAAGQLHVLARHRRAMQRAALVRLGRLEWRDLEREAAWIRVQHMQAGVDQWQTWVAEREPDVYPNPNTRALGRLARRLRERGGRLVVMEAPLHPVQALLLPRERIAAARDELSRLAAADGFTLLRKEDLPELDEDDFVGLGARQRPRPRAPHRVPRRLRRSDALSRRCASTATNSWCSWRRCWRCCRSSTGANGTACCSPRATSSTARGTCRSCSLLVFTTALDFFCGARVARAATPATKRGWLAFSLLGNLGPLFYFKYGNFFLENVAFVAGVDPEPFYLNVVIPLGISFYTFQSLSYTLDMYRDKHEPCTSFLDFALYVTFFPQLVAGPILRSSEFLPQLTRTDARDASPRCCAASSCSCSACSRRWWWPTTSRSSPTACSRARATTAARPCWPAPGRSGRRSTATSRATRRWRRASRPCSAISLPRNFDYPQLRHNPSLYRRTWHMTLGNWITDYVYRPLGGSRVGDARFAFNLIFTWMLIGLWHGAAWNFVLWGLWNGVVLAIYSVGMRRKRWALPAFPGKLFCGWLLIVASNLFSSIFFRSPSAADAGGLLERLFTWAPGREIAPEWWGVLALLLGVHALSFWHYQEDVLAAPALAGPHRADHGHRAGDRLPRRRRPALHLLPVLVTRSGEVAEVPAGDGAELRQRGRLRLRRGLRLRVHLDRVGVRRLRASRARAGPRPARSPRSAAARPAASRPSQPGAFASSSSRGPESASRTPRSPRGSMRRRDAERQRRMQRQHLRHRFDPAARDAELGRDALGASPSSRRPTGSRAPRAPRPRSWRCDR